MNRTARRSEPAVKAIIAASFPHFRGRKIRVVSFERPTWLTVHWDEGQKDDVALLSQQGVGRLVAQGAPWQNTHGVLAEVEQPEGSIMVVLHHDRGEQSLTISVRPGGALGQIGSNLLLTGGVFPSRSVERRITAQREARA